MDSREQAPETTAIHGPDEEATATGPVPAVDAPPSPTIVQDFLGSDDLEPTPVGTDPALMVRPAALAAAPKLGDSLESTPAGAGPNSTLREPPPNALVRYVPRDAPAALPAATLVQDLELRVTDPAVVRPALPPAANAAPPAAPTLRQDLLIPERRPAPPAPPPAPKVRQPPALPLALPPHGTDLETPGAASASTGVPTVSMKPLRALPPAAAPVAMPTPQMPQRQGQPRPRADPLRERRMAAMRARLARLSQSLIAKVEQKPPVWRVLVLGVLGGLLVAGAVLALYFAVRDTRPDAPAAQTHGSKLKDFGAKPEGSDHPVVDSFDDAVEFSKRKSATPGGPP